MHRSKTNTTTGYCYCDCYCYYYYYYYRNFTAHTTWLVTTRTFRLGKNATVLLNAITCTISYHLSNFLIRLYSLMNRGRQGKKACTEKKTLMYCKSCAIYHQNITNYSANNHTQISQN